jgi:RNA polymerase sigma-70 factor (ECF subfamily)
VDTVADHGARPRKESGVRTRLDFEQVYAEWFDFIWRSVRRLGVAEDSVDDVVQDVLLVLYRKLPEFEGRSTLKTWIFGIARRVVRDHRRSLSRRGPQDELRESWIDGPDGDQPAEQAARSEAAQIVHAILDELDEDKREVFVLAELEQMTAPEIAEAVDANLNTVYARLRAARQLFERAVQRHRARDERRLG